MLIAKSAFPHICQFYGSLATGVHEPVTILGVELCSGNNFRQFLHISRLDIHNVEALILDIEIPEINAEIITRNESLSIRIHGNTIDMVSVGICVSPPGYCCYHGIVVRQSRKPERR